MNWDNAFDKAKTLINGIKLVFDSWKFMAPVVGILVSGLGFTYADNMDKNDQIAQKDTELAGKDRQLATVATYYAKTEKVPETPQIAPSCDCIQAIRQHERRYHE